MSVGIPWVICWYAVISVVTFGVYAWDKHRARVSRWRIAEQTLHFLELLGGWPGALIAQRRFHHKLKKTGYMRVFWMIVFLHGVGWGLYLYYFGVKV